MKVTIDEKEIPVRMPTPAEWVEWQGAQKVTTYDLGDGETRREVFDAEEQAGILFRAIRQDGPGGPDIDSSEAVFALNALSHCWRSGDVERQGDEIVFPVTWHDKTETIRCRKPRVSERRAFVRAGQHSHRARRRARA